MPNLDTRAKDDHSGFYLTLVSMMQSLALGYLLQLTGGVLVERGYLPWTIALQALAALTMIILVWHEYAIGTIVYYWSLDIADSVIPFLIGISQYCVISVIGLPHGAKIYGIEPFELWLLGLAGFAFCGILAYFNQARKATVGSADDLPLLRNPKRGILHASVHTVVFLLAAFTFWFWPVCESCDTLVAGLVVVAFLYELIRASGGYKRMSKNQAEPGATDNPDGA